MQTQHILCGALVRALMAPIIISIIGKTSNRTNLLRDYNAGLIGALAYLAGIYNTWEILRDFPANEL